MIKHCQNGFFKASESSPPLPPHFFLDCVRWSTLVDKYKLHRHSHTTFMTLVNQSCNTKYSHGSAWGWGWEHFGWFSAGWRWQTTQRRRFDWTHQNIPMLHTDTGLRKSSQLPGIHKWIQHCWLCSIINPQMNTTLLTLLYHWSIWVTYGSLLSVIFFLSCGLAIVQSCSLWRRGLLWHWLSPLFLLCIGCRLSKPNCILSRPDGVDMSPGLFWVRCVRVSYVLNHLEQIFPTFITSFQVKHWQTCHFPHTQHKYMHAHTNIYTYIYK